MSSSQTLLFDLAPWKLFSFALGTGIIILLFVNFGLSEPPLLITLIGTVAVMAVYVYLIYFNLTPDISNEQKADSCYYLGFILTLVAMVISLINFNLGEGQELFRSIVRNFGLALVTTIIGIVVRIVWLQLLADRVTEAEETIRQKMLLEADKLKLEVERITSSFQVLANQAESVTNPLRTNISNLENTLEVPKKLSEALEKVAKNSESLSDKFESVNREVDNFSPSKIQELINKVDQLDEILKSVNPDISKNLLALNTSFANSKSSIEDYINTLLSLIDETEKTFGAVNRSLRANAEYLKKELNE